MATNMRFTHSFTTIPDFIADFTGREGWPGYDATKPISIDAINRAQAWTLEMMAAFIVNILQGFPSPLFVIVNNAIVDGGNRSTGMKHFTLNKFKVSLGAFVGFYSDLVSIETHAPAIGDAAPVPYSAAYLRDRQRFRSNWDKHSFPVTNIRGATADEKAEIYSRYNRGVIMKLGQHLDSWIHQPIVKLAMAMIFQTNAVVFPLANLIRQVYQSSWKKTVNRNELGFAFQILVASSFGREHFHTKIEQFLPIIQSTTLAQVDLSKLKTICEIVASADPEKRVEPKKKAACFKRFIGAMIYDIWDRTPIDMAAKWRPFFVDAYNILGKEAIKALVDVGTARAQTVGRLGGVSMKVQEYLDTKVAPAPDADGGEDDESTDTDE